MIMRDNRINWIDMMYIRITKEKIAIWALALFAITLL
ncbi:hypothetical protein METP1_03396 [Methanosarcinales archaeon]|nr:hypothetical protein METP1_03396 [Methanosarcinales archaeon]